MKKIANYVSVSRYKDGGVVGLGSAQLVIESKYKWELAVKIISLWKTPREEAEIIELMKKNINNIGALEDVIEIIALLRENNFLINQGSFISTDRFSRNKLYYSYLGGDPDEVQSNLENSQVTILGCGGIGNHISVILATAGIKKINLVDPDVIELSNLTRQVLFTENDVGKYKVDILERELKARNSKLIVESYRHQISSVRDVERLPSSDLLIVSADYPSDLIRWVNKACVKGGRAYVNVGYMNDISVVGPFFVPGLTPCFECARFSGDVLNQDSLKEEISAINGDFKPATFPPANNIAASFAAGDIIRYLGKFGQVESLGRRLGVHTSQLKVEVQEIQHNKRCLICGEM